MPRSACWAPSVATACLLPGSPAAEVAQIPEGNRKTLSVEHPTGEMSCVLELDDKGRSPPPPCCAPRAS
jgi:4-oxalomesaconate tautomerase